MPHRFSPEWWQTIFETLSFMAAALAGFWWFVASKLEPEKFTIQRQSAVNARAALFASFAALSQAIAIAAKLSLA